LLSRFGVDLAFVLYASGITAALLSIAWRPVVGVFALVVLCPLQTVRYRMFEYPLGASIIGLLLLGVIVGSLLRQGWPFGPTPWSGLIWMYLLFTLFSLCLGSLSLGAPFPFTTGDDQRVSEWGDYIQMPLLLLAVAAAVKRRWEIQAAVLLMCVTVVMMDVRLWDMISGRDYTVYSHDLRAQGTMGYAGPNGLAAFQAQFSCFALALAAIEQRIAAKLGFYMLAGFTGLCLLYSLSRSGYLAFFAGCAFVGLVKNRKLLAMLALTVTGWGVMAPEAVRMRVSDTYDSREGAFDHSSELRLQLWEEALPLFLSDPVLGRGFQTYAHMRNLGGYWDTHNLYLKTLVETGLIGLLLLLGLGARIGWTGMRLFGEAQDGLSVSIGLGIATWLVCAGVANLFGDRWMYFQVQGYFWILAGLAARCVVLEGEAREHAVETGVGRAESVAENGCKAVPA
jgi:putative inorganic carbon (hco3(-)) transporter